MQSSLDKLVQSLPEDSFDILDNHFEYCDQNDVKLLQVKVSTPTPTWTPSENSS